MTEKTAAGQPGQTGQIHTPNPVELFWEKNRKSVLTFGGIVAVGIVAFYGLKYMKQRSIDDRWGQLAAATGLEKGYAEEGNLAALFKSQQQPQQKQVWFNYYIQSAQHELVSDVLTDLESVSRSEIDERLAAAAGKDTEPLILWAAANRALQDRDWDACERYLTRLESGFPEHFLCAETTYPVQFREEKEKDKDAEKADKEKGENQKKSGKEEKPELVPPVRGSEVGMLRARIAREKQFRDEHAALYTAPTPDPSPTVVLKLSGDDYAGEIKIRFFDEAAPKHVANFVQKCKDGIYNGQRIHLIQRARPDSPGASSPEQLQFGLEASKGDDRSKWVAATDADKNYLDFEDSPISHFPGMVAAVNAGENQTSDTQIWINANDCAGSFDGSRVVFGRVVEGLELVRDIIQGPFENEDMRRSGQGRPSGTLTIESATVIE